MTYLGAHLVFQLLTSASRPKVKVVFHGHIWVGNMLNEMRFASFWKHVPTKGSQEDVGTQSIGCEVGGCVTLGSDLTPEPQALTS